MSTNHAEIKRASEKKLKINRKRLTVSVSVLAAAIIAAAYIGYAGSYDKIYPRTYLCGEKISGLTYDAVLDKLKNESLGSNIPKTLEFSFDGENFSLSSSEIKLSENPEKTAKAAFSDRNEKGFFSRAALFTKSLFKKTNLSPELSYSEKKLNRAISEHTKGLEIEPVDASYEINGDKLIIKKGRAGKKINSKTLKASLVAYVQDPSSPIELKLEKTEEKEFDLDKFYKEITSDPTDAYFSRDENGNVIVVPDKPKISVDKSKIKDALNSDKKETTIKVSLTNAAVRASELESALFSGTMGSWTSHFSSSNRPRSANVALAAQRINGKVLLPGETFSYDKTVGPRTAKNGFQSAGVYINNKVEQGIGGGICQTSSTLYSAVLYANLEIVSRTSHSLPVSYMPPGQDATIAEGSIDFVFRNNTNYPVKIVATTSGGSVTCSIVGTPVAGQKVVISNTTTAVYEPKIEIKTDSNIPKGFKKTVTGSKGSAVSSTRTVYQNGSVISSKKLGNSVYNSTPTVITVNPEDRNTPPEALREYSSAAVADPPEQIEAEGEPTAPSEEPQDNTVIEIQ